MASDPIPADKKKINVSTYNELAKKIEDRALELNYKKVYDEKGKEYYKEHYLTSIKSILPVICVDEINERFNKYVNVYLFQDNRRWRIPVGISFSEKSIYVANQKDIIGIIQYKKLLKRFYELFNVIH